MNNKNAMLIGSLATISVGITIGFSVALYKILPKMPMKKYTEACLYLGYLDDEISRMRFEGDDDNSGIKIKFPPKRESLMYRYRMHLSLHKKLSQKQLEKEIRLYERMYEEEQELLINK